VLFQKTPITLVRFGREKLKGYHRLAGLPFCLIDISDKVHGRQLLWEPAAMPSFVRHKLAIDSVKQKTPPGFPEGVQGSNLN
jgi:hypothetical protein